MKDKRGCLVGIGGLIAYIGLVALVCRFDAPYLKFLCYTCAGLLGTYFSRYLNPDGFVKKKKKKQWLLCIVIAFLLPAVIVWVAGCWK